jgi:gluconolactonase
MPDQNITPGEHAARRDWERGVVRYPDPAVETVDPRFNEYRLSGAAIERLWVGGRWTEGPVWFGDGRFLLWSDIPNDRMLRWSEETGAVSVFRSPSNNSNGNTRDRQGRLVTCEHGTRRVTRTEYDGRITVLVDSFDGKRLNAPNDLVVKSDDSIWFTDPGYGILKHYEGFKAEPELPTRVYRIDARTGRTTIVTEAFDRPNGLCFSPDERRLYIVDTGAPGNIRVFDVDDEGRLSNDQVFVEMRPGGSDGIRCDTDGNVWSAAGWAGAGFDGVHCYAPDGDLIGRIHLPETCSNLCFGGQKKNRLFMTASQSLYALYVDAIGV